MSALPPLALPRRDVTRPVENPPLFLPRAPTEVPIAKERPPSPVIRPGLPCSSVYVEQGTRLINEDLQYMELIKSVKAMASRVASPFRFVRREALKELLETLRVLAEGAANPEDGYPSDAVTWDGVKPERKEQIATIRRAMSSNLIAPIFHKVIPRRDLSLSIAGGGGLHLPTLPREVALQWTTCAEPQTLLKGFNEAVEKVKEHERNPPTPCALSTEPSFEEGIAHGSDETTVLMLPENPETPTHTGSDNMNLAEENSFISQMSSANCDDSVCGTVLSEENSNASAKIAEESGRIVAEMALYGVTLEDQDIALRIIAGLCILVPTQKLNIVDSPLLPFAVEAFCCCLQHIQALFCVERELRFNNNQVLRLAQRCADGGYDSDDTNTSITTLEAELMLERECNPECLWKRNDSPIRSADSLRTESSGNCYTENENWSYTEPSISSTKNAWEISSMRPELINVMCSLIDAVEAACHYCPRAMGQFVHLGGVRHLLNLACTPYTPEPIRLGALDTCSFLMQEVEPYRREQGTASPIALSPALMLDILPSPSQTGTIGSDDGTVFGTSDGGNSSLQQLTRNAMIAIPSHLYMDRATASKFDNAIRSWLNHHHLFTLAETLLSLRDVHGVTVPEGVTAAEAQRAFLKGNQQRDQMYTQILADIDKRMICTV